MGCEEGKLQTIYFAYKIRFVRAQELEPLCASDGDHNKDVLFIMLEILIVVQELWMECH